MEPRKHHASLVENKKFPAQASPLWNLLRGTISDTAFGGAVCAPKAESSGRMRLEARCESKSKRRGRLHPTQFAYGGFRATLAAL